jgi:endonuclease III
MTVDIDSIIRILREETQKYTVPVVDLIKVQTNSPFKVLIATILSARTNDATTANVSERLFRRIQKITDLNTISYDELVALLYPVGFYKTKAKHLKQLPLVLDEEFSGEIPQTVEELIKLPGVGRKTANLVVAVAFEKPAICVDTHVHKIMNRLDYVRTKTPFETEMALRKKLPQKYWLDVNSLFVAFGQQVCRPVSPYCSFCPLNTHCKKRGVMQSR